jgi:hypothetical protein
MRGNGRGVTSLTAGELRGALPGDRFVSAGPKEVPVDEISTSRRVARRSTMISRNCGVNSGAMGAQSRALSV